MADEENRQQLAKWQLRQKVNILIDQASGILEFGSNHSILGLAQSVYVVEPRNPSLRIQVLRGVNTIGFTAIDHQASVLPGTSDSSLGYDAFIGELWAYGKCEYRGPSCQYGDIIELGIKFPLNFVNEGNCSVKLYLSINDRLITEKVIAMPTFAIYPTISMWHNAKVKYFKMIR
ncbi:MAG TPA: hypothetical protein VHZ50_18830 [Puia sp.]|nr:hypothetical protein [Puia sp.]